MSEYSLTALLLQLQPKSKIIYAEVGPSNTSTNTVNMQTMNENQIPSQEEGIQYAEINFHTKAAFEPQTRKDIAGTRW